jgi:hypothetical protein
MPNAYTEDIDRWVNYSKFTVSDGLARRKARQTVSRILAPPSELFELWAESDQATSWKSADN